jgi:single-strand DNA-binding protein
MERKNTMLNKTMIMGRLTKDPEMRYTQSNIAVTNFTVAVDRKKSKKDDEKKTDFFPVVAWGKLGEFVNQYFTQGQQVVVVGRLQNSSWEDDQGTKHFRTDIIAEDCFFAGSKGGTTPASVESSDEYPFA